MKEYPCAWCDAVGLTKLRIQIRIEALQEEIRLRQNQMDRLNDVRELIDITAAIAKIDDEISTRICYIAGLREALGMVG